MKDEAVGTKLSEDVESDGGPIRSELQDPRRLNIGLYQLTKRTLSSPDAIASD